jgi:hypothetical protein
VLKDPNLRELILQEAHDSSYSLHPGKTYGSEGKILMDQYEEEDR